MLYTQENFRAFLRGLDELADGCACGGAGADRSDMVGTIYKTIQ